MRLWSQFQSWMRAMAYRARMESDMDAELRFHMEAYAEDLERQGVDRDDAMRRAHTEFGGRLAASASWKRCYKICAMVSGAWPRVLVSPRSPC